MKTRTYVSLLLLIALSAGLPAAHGAAQEYPTKPVRLLVGSSAGGGGDILARSVIQRLNDTLGQPVIIDNRGGAGGAIACEIAARAAPDGYTLLIASVGMLAINPALFPQLAYKPMQDFAPVTLLAETPYALVVHPSLPARSVKELVAHLKERPGQLNFASGGAGTGNHFSGELFKLAAGVNITHVPFKGTGPALADVIAGRVQIMFGNLIAAMPQVKSGRLRLLALTSAKRSGSAPDVPTVAESGYTDFQTTTWHGLLAPTGTSKAIVTRLGANMVKILRQPDIAERLASQGTETIASTPESFAEHLKIETAKWARVVKQAGIKAE